MKTLHFTIITCCVIGIFVTLGVFLLFDQWQLESHIVEEPPEIQNIQVEPATIKVGDTFTVSAELINNSQNPIYVELNPCSGPVFVFDSQVTVDVKEMMMCLGWSSIKEVNHGEKLIKVGPGPIYNTFRATESGITNATVTFSYFENNPIKGSGNPDIKKTISKSFLFTISN